MNMRIKYEIWYCVIDFNEEIMKILNWSWKIFNHMQDDNYLVVIVLWWRGREIIVLSLVLCPVLPQLGVRLPGSTSITSQGNKVVWRHLEMASPSSSSSGVSTRGRGSLCSSLATEASLELRCSLGKKLKWIIQLCSFSSIQSFAHCMPDRKRSMRSL